jgi:hypothetical protein
MIQTGAVNVEATVRDTHGQTQVVVLGYRICGGVYKAKKRAAVLLPSKYPAIANKSVLFLQSS